MKESIIKEVIKLASVEYEIFAKLALRLRIAAVLALALLFFALVILTHLAIDPFLVDGVESFIVLSAFYFFILTLSVLAVLPILFPRLQKTSSIALFIVCFFNFFPLAILLLIPQLRKFKAVITGIVVFLCIVLGGIVIMLEGTNEGILTARPNSGTIFLWLLGSIAIFSGIFIYGFVTEKVSIEKTRIETEIKVAQNIQAQLVPSIQINDRRYQIFGKTNPAYQIGGDFFEVVKVSDKKTVMAIGDVSGHNIAAGLLMAITKGAFRTGLQYTSNLKNLVESMNRTVLENSDKKMFVSFKCGEINFTDSSLTVVNAGHLPVLHYRCQDKKIVEWNQDGMALGLSNDGNFESQRIPFDNGDVFFFLTDGIVEAASPSNEEFGFDRVKTRLQYYAKDLAPREIYQKIISDLSNFTNSTTHEDDVTFLSLKVV